MADPLPRLRAAVSAQAAAAASLPWAATRRWRPETHLAVNDGQPHLHELHADGADRDAGAVDHRCAAGDGGIDRIGDALGIRGVELVEVKGQPVARGKAGIDRTLDRRAAGDAATRRDVDCHFRPVGGIDAKPPDDEVALHHRVNLPVGAIERRQHEARSVSWRTEPDGMVVLTARLTPDTAGAVCAAIDTSVTRNHAPAGASLTHQRADALAALVTDGGGSVTAEVVVHVNAEGNTLTDGTPLSDHAVTALLPEGFVSLLLHDNQGRPIDASPRRRLPTRRQQRVLDQIDPECRQPGCHATAFLQYDHIQPDAQGGTTVLANLQRLCGPHNRARTGATRSPERNR